MYYLIFSYKLADDAQDKFEKQNDSFSVYNLFWIFFGCDIYETDKFRINTH